MARVKQKSRNKQTGSQKIAGGSLSRACLDVVVELAEPLPLSEAELAAIELLLGPELDHLLAIDSTPRQALDHSEEPGRQRPDFSEPKEAGTLPP